MSFGVVYSLTESIQHEKELNYSIKSLKRFHPNWEICVFFAGKIQKRIDGVSYRELELENPFILKVRAIINSPFQSSLFLDTDIEIKASILEIKDYLETFDLLVCHSAHVDFKRKKLISLKRVNGEKSTGFIGYSRNDSVDAFFDLWLQKMQNYKSVTFNSKFGDQPIFNQVKNDLVANNNWDLKVLNLSNKRYNVVSFVYNILTTKEKKQVKSIHHHRLYKFKTRWAYYNLNLAMQLLKIKSFFQGN